MMEKSAVKTMQKLQYNYPLSLKVWPQFVNNQASQYDPMQLCKSCGQCNFASLWTMQFQHMCCVMLGHPSHFNNSQEPLTLPMILIIDPQKLAQCEVPSSKWSLVTNLCQRTTSNMADTKCTCKLYNRK
jgi:hypothetical protein